jgi:hypothetical protein
MSTTTNRYLSYPAAAAGISLVVLRQPSILENWAYGSFAEVVPASTITSDFYIAGVSYTFATPLPNGTGHVIDIDVRTGSGGNEVKLCSFKYVYVSSTTGHVPSVVSMLPEPAYVAANTRISARAANSNTNGVYSIAAFKIIYQMA